MKKLSICAAIALLLALFVALDAQTTVIGNYSALSGDVSATAAGVVTVNQMTSGLVSTNGNNLWVNPASGNAGVQFRNGGTFEAMVSWIGSGTKVMLTTDGSATNGIWMDTSGNIVLQQSGNVRLPNLHSTTGTRYLCVDTAGNISASASACSGT